MPEAALHVGSGKVRELYALDDDRLLLVASDRISTFDVVLPTEIPDKGRVLTGLAGFWFARTRDLCANHLLALRADGRSTECRRLEMLPIECVVRGYLSGSGWKDYTATGTVCGHVLPAGLTESAELPEPIFTPATKAEQGAHDENVSFEVMEGTLGRDLARRVRRAALDLYAAAIGVAARAGILIADTKFEFGLRPGTNELVLIDEVLTPDSSRFWDASIYEPGRPQASFDKQFVRDWLETQPWDKSAPGPALPEWIVEGTRERYVAAFERITGASFERYLREDVIAR
jgi:phosphoribosylaminoimidazole-succinocarboxamide synthase